MKLGLLEREGKAEEVTGNSWCYIPSRSCHQAAGQQGYISPSTSSRQFEAAVGDSVPTEMSRLHALEPKEMRIVRIKSRLSRVPPLACRKGALWRVA